METAKTILRKLLSRRSENVSNDLLYVCIIEGETLQINELGLYRAFQALCILNFPLFSGSDAVRKAEIRCRWIDTTCHINELILDTEIARGDIDNTLNIVPCTKCGVGFLDVIAVEIEIMPPGVCCQFRIEDVLRREFAEAVNGFRNLMTKKEQTAEDLARGVRSVNALARDALLQGLNSKRILDTDPRQFKLALFFDPGDKRFVTKLVRDLELAGMHCWWDIESLGSDKTVIADTLVKICRDCSVFIYVCSTDFGRGTDLCQELCKQSKSEMGAGFDRRVIPILLEGDPEEIMPDSLKRLGVIDFSRHYVASKYLESVQRLIETVRKHLSHDETG